jgi:hypothetical protein
MEEGEAMKRSVKRPSLRAKLFIAAGVPVCGAGIALACEPPTGVTGLVTAPMAAASSDASQIAMAGDAGGGDAAVAYRQLDEPTQQSQCQKAAVNCVDPEPEALGWPYPPPFEHCKPMIGNKGESRFSGVETNKHRSAESDDKCCYVDCGRRYGGYGRARP